MPKLFPKSVSAVEGVEGEHAHEENGKNAKYSRSPMKEFDTLIQGSAGLPQTIERKSVAKTKALSARQAKRRDKRVPRSSALDVSSMGSGS